MSKPPYPGQGTPLPGEMSINGDWIIEDQVFLCWRSQHGDAFMAVSTSGASCTGFDAFFLAEKLETDAEMLIEMNRQHALSVSFRMITPGPGADATTLFEFRTPFSGIQFRFNAAAIKGHA